MERLSLEGILKIYLFQPPCNGQWTFHRTGCSEPFPTWPGALPGMGYPQLLMATLGSGILFFTDGGTANMKNDAGHFRLWWDKSRETNTGDAGEKRQSDFCLSFHGWKVALSLPTLEYPGPFPLSPKSFAYTYPQDMEDVCFNFWGVWFPKSVSDNILCLLWISTLDTSFCSRVASLFSYLLMKCVVWKAP